MAKFLSFVLLLLLVSTVYAQMTPADRTYIDAQHQKTIAQINSKIEATEKRIQDNFNKEIESQKQILKDELGREVQSSLKTVTIGLAGLMIVTLGIFKVIDLRLTSTKNVRKYEKHLREKQEEYDKLLSILKKDSERVIQYKSQLLNYHHQLQAFAKGQGLAPQPVAQPQLNPPIPQQKQKRRFLFFKRKDGTK